MKKYAIFGAGHDGKFALKDIGRENVVCFIDNDPTKWNKRMKGIVILSIDEFIEKFKDVSIIIATKAFPMIVHQLEERKDKLDYQVWIPNHNWMDSIDGDLVINPYKDEKNSLQRDMSNDEATIDAMNAFTDIVASKNLMFNHVEIETYNRCNGVCEFCPVSVKADTRSEKLMPESLFYKIIGELSEMSFRGELGLFSNNEPFLDRRIIGFCKYAREKLPNAKIYIITNGTLLTMDMFIEVIDYLDELIIDNYNAKLELTPNNVKIKNYCEDHPELKEKVAIVLRNPKEILTSRAGQAPNRTKTEQNSAVKCCLPFRQLIIRPDGKVSICCNDALGYSNMGDVNEESLVDIWWGERFKEVREKILAGGRKETGFCRNCDTLLFM